MKRSTIIFVFLLAALIAASVLYYWWRQAEPPAPGQAPSLISLLPADATYVFYADAAALRSSPFIQQLLVALPSPKEDREYAEFVRRTGFDYTRDLDRMALAIRPNQTEFKGRKDETVTAVVEGRFDRAKISTYATGSGKRADRNGHEAYLVPSQPQGDVLLVFLAPDRVLLTNRTDGALPGNSPAEGANATGQSQLQERITRVAASELFAVGRVSPLPTNLLPSDIEMGELKKTLESIQWLTLAIRSGSQPGQTSGGRADGDPPVQPVAVVLEAECASTADAKKLVWSAEGLRVLARMALSDPKSTAGMDPALTALFQTILKDGKISSADRFARLNFSLGPEFLAALEPQPAPPRKKANR